MLRRMCGIRLEDRLGVDGAVMCEKLGISELVDKICQKRLRWYSSMVMWLEAVTGSINVVRSKMRDLQGDGDI